MMPRSFIILELIGDASNDEQIHGLVEIVYDEASVDEMAEVKGYLCKKMKNESRLKAKNNYKRAIKLLE